MYKDGEMWEYPVDTEALNTRLDMVTDLYKYVSSKTLSLFIYTNAILDSNEGVSSNEN